MDAFFLLTYEDGLLIQVVVSQVECAVFASELYYLNYLECSNADSALFVDWHGLHKSCKNNYELMDTSQLFVEFVVRTIH